LSSAETQGTLEKVVLTLAPWVKNQVHLLCCSITQGAKAITLAEDYKYVYVYLPTVDVFARPVL
jgi:hypothetical protein